MSFFRRIIFEKIIVKTKSIENYGYKNSWFNCGIFLPHLGCESVVFENLRQQALDVTGTHGKDFFFANPFIKTVHNYSY